MKTILAGRTMRRVALIYNSTLAYDLCVAKGVAAYLQREPGWNVYVAKNSRNDRNLPDLSLGGVDGVLADFDRNPNVAMAVVTARMPAVGFGSGYGWYAQESGIPYFFTNNQAIARLAADHLIARGFRQFAYCAYRRSFLNGWSKEREQEFQSYTSARGFRCSIYRGSYWKDSRWADIQDALCSWLLSLPKPIGIMAANDALARQVLEACRVCGLHVPDQVGVLGVDNDDVMCRLCSPLLSSIEQGAERIGYEAATLLDRLMGGEKPGKKRYVVDPVGLVTRRSTDIAPIADPQVAKAMMFIREHACEGLKVARVVAAANTSRSGLEMHFKAEVGKTLHEAIRDFQLERAKSMLAQTDRSPKDVAAATGFKSVQHLSAVFRRAVGLPPAAYRRTMRAGLLAEVS